MYERTSYQSSSQVRVKTGKVVGVFQFHPISSSFFLSLMDIGEFSEEPLLFLIPALFPIAFPLPGDMVLISLDEEEGEFLLSPSIPLGEEFLFFFPLEAMDQSFHHLWTDLKILVFWEDFLATLPVGTIDRALKEQGF